MSEMEQKRCNCARIVFDLSAVAPSLPMHPCRVIGRKVTIAILGILNFRFGAFYERIAWSSPFECRAFTQTGWIG